MNHTETRIFTLPSLKSEYAIVSMPKTAWYWLDDLVKKDFPAGGYKALLKDFEKKSSCPATLSLQLRIKAQEYAEKRMIELYGLANDNVPADGYGDLKNNPSQPSRPDLSARMPAVYRLLHFMPHPTYLTTVWERRNFHLRGSRH